MSDTANSPAGNSPAGNSPAGNSPAGHSPADKQRNIIGIVALVGAIVVGAIMILAGFQKLMDNPELWEAFERFGWPRWTYFATGAAEVIGGLGLLWSKTRPYAGALIAAVMAGAFLTNVVNGDYQFLPINVLFGGIAAWVGWRALPRRKVAAS